MMNESRSLPEFVKWLVFADVALGLIMAGSYWLNPKLCLVIAWVILAMSLLCAAAFVTTLLVASLKTDEIVRGAVAKESCPHPGNCTCQPLTTEEREVLASYEHTLRRRFRHLHSVR